MRAALAGLIPGGDVATRTIKSGAWASGTNVLDRLLQLIKLAVLARILSPQDFGLFGIGLLTLGALTKLTELGIEQELIHRNRRTIDSSLNTAWLLKIVRGVLLFGVAYLAAPYVAGFFGQPRVTDVIRALGLLPLILGLENPAIVYFQKNLEFHREFVLTLSRSFVDVVLSVAFAVVLGSVWAFVFGVVAGGLARTLVSYLVHPYRPGLSFSRDEARQILGYGKWVSGGSVVVFFTTQGDDAFVGWLLGATALGYYQVAYRFGKAPATEVTQVLTRVIFPAFSELQDRDAETSSLLLTVLRLTAFVSMPMAVGIAVVAPVFVTSVLGPGWSPAIVLFQVVAVHGLFTSVGSISGPIVMARGRPDLRTKWQLLNLGLLLSLVYPLSQLWGVAGVAAAVVAASAVTTATALSLALGYTDLGMRDLLRELLYPATGSVLMALPLYVLSATWLASGVVSLLLLVALGVAIYGLSVAWMDRYLRYDILSLIGDVSRRAVS
jgi:PST family polysaccharide transporter/lipopolysaccharide exporter